jgi:hypothetical protein
MAQTSGHRRGIGLALALVTLTACWGDGALAQRKASKGAAAQGDQRPYVLMVTSLDPPLGKLGNDQIALLNDTPFDGVAISLLGIYDGGPLPGEAATLARCGELRALSKKPLWPRVYLNRLVGFLPTASRRSICVQPEYFDRIKGFDLWNAAGARDDFLTLWRLGLRAAKALGAPGVVADFESYNCGGLCNPVTLAAAAGRSLPETQAALEDLGVRLADIVAEEYPEAVVWSLFTHFGRPDWFKAGAMPLPGLHAYIFKGMLERAQRRHATFKLISGGEDDLGYYSESLGVLQEKIARRAAVHTPLLSEFRRWLVLGGTLTVWNDDTRLTDWTRQDAGPTPPFKRFADFQPLLAELLRDYRYVWLYVRRCTDYNPFEAATAPKLNQALREVLDASRSAAAERRKTPSETGRVRSR